MLSGIIEFHSKISAIAPTQVEIKIPAFVGNERQTQAFIFADRPVPTALGAGYFSRETSHHFKLLVGDAHYVEKKVVHRISKTPQHIPRAIFRAIPLRRNRIIHIADPKKWIEFLQRCGVVAWNIFYDLARGGVCFSRLVGRRTFARKCFATTKQ